MQISGEFTSVTKALLLDTPGFWRTYYHDKGYSAGYCRVSGGLTSMREATLLDTAGIWRTRFLSDPA
jgi:hypothetical protein